MSQAEVLVKRFRSGFTGAEIDEILASVKTKVDERYIANDFEGGTERVASAELAKNLNERLVQLTDPNFFAQMLEQVPDFNMFTDDYKSKLEVLNDMFKGVFLNPQDRNDKLNATNFLGGEITFLLSDGTEADLAEWSVWNNQTSRWVAAKFYDDGSVPDLNITAPGTFTLATVDLNKSTLVRFGVIYQLGTVFHYREFTLKRLGSDVHVVVDRGFGNSADPSSWPYTPATVVTAQNRMGLMVTVANTGATIKTRKLLEM